MGFEVGDRVVVLRSTRTGDAGIAGWRGEVAGASYAGDELSREVLAYAVAMDEADGRTWMVDPDDLEAELNWHGSAERASFTSQTAERESRMGDRCRRF